MLGSRVCAGPKRLLLRRSWSLSSRTGTLTRSISSSQFCLANSASPSNRPSLSPVRSRQKANVATTVAVNSSAAEELSTARGPSPPASHVEAAKPFSDIPGRVGLNSYREYEQDRLIIYFLLSCHRPKAVDQP